ncbi:MAG TPA: hypothetical protein VGC16_05915 [Rhizomicrobium sp.]
MFSRAVFASLVLLSLPGPAMAQDQTPADPPATPVVADTAGYTQDTPVEKIAADPSAKAILDKDIPGLLDDARYPLFKSMSLKQMQQASDGDLSRETVDKTVTDLQALFPH